MARTDMSPLKVPPSRPFTRAPIKPVQRHQDPRKRRTPKHPLKEQLQ